MRPRAGSLRGALIRVAVALPLLSLAAGCGLPSLPYRSVRAVVDPNHARRTEADRRAGREMRRQEAREYRAYVRCREEGYPDC